MNLNWRSTISATCLVLTLILGLFFPTSIDAEISKELSYCCSLALFTIYVAFGLLAGSLTGAAPLLCFILINASLLLATLFSDLADLAPGAFTFYFLLSCLYLLDLRTIRLPKLISSLFSIISVFLLVLATAATLQYPPVTEFFVDNYSAYYPELVPAMLRLGKPVLMFGSHSLAGFFYYLLFLLNFQKYSHQKRSLHFLLALGFLFVLMVLNSLTGYVYLGIGVIQVLLHFGAHRNLFLRLAGFVGALSLVWLLATSGDARAAVASLISPLLSSPANGFAARYASAGSLAPNFDYILANPLSPIGVRNSDLLWLGDSGPVEYMLRGSVFLLVGVYVGLYLFLKRNLRSAAHCALLYFVYLAFEIGFSTLIYLRTLYLLPFIVVFLNSFKTSSAESPGAVTGLMPAQQHSEQVVT